MKARAIENQSFMIGVNRTGKDTSNTYNGYSSIFDPTGKEVVQLANDEKIIEAETDLEILSRIRTTLPFLNDIKLI